ncbi:MAG: nucleotidyltransferase domain-containing protein [Patescibacteria group bacterium]|jgi:predicted nucleotidyltransferase
MLNFKSKITKEVLGYLLLNPREELYLNEMSRKFGLDRGNLARKLAELEKEGIIVKNKKGNLSLYKINRGYPFLAELKKIFQKSYGLENLLKEKLKKIKGLNMAVIFGSYANDRLSAESDIDLLLVGSHKSLDAQAEIAELQKKFGREINIIDMTEKEFGKKKKAELLKNILINKHIRLI